MGDNDEPAPVGSAISAMGRLARPESLSYVVAHAAHDDSEVRFAVACAPPSVAGSGWLESTHPAVTTLMDLTSDTDCSAHASQASIDRVSPQHRCRIRTGNDAVPQNRDGLRVVATGHFREHVEAQPTLRRRRSSRAGRSDSPAP